MGTGSLSRRIGVLGCFFLVLLRLSIGWQFIYEGLWKHDTLKTPTPWSAEGYLRTARGPLRNKYRSLLDDPDGFDRLDEKKVTAAWDQWVKEFEEAYNLDAVQKQNLSDLVNGPKEYHFPLTELPAGIDFKKAKLPKEVQVRYDAEKRQLVATSHLLPAERERLKKLADALAEPKKEPSPKEASAPPADAKPADAKPADAKPVVVDPLLVEKYKAAVDGLYKRASQLSLKERLRDRLVVAPDPDKRPDPAPKTEAERDQAATQQAEIERTTSLELADPEDYVIDPQRPNDLMEYKKYSAYYEQEMRGAKEHYKLEHLNFTRQELQKRRAKVVGPIDALTADLRTQAEKLLKPNQSPKGKEPEPPLKNKVTKVNQQTIWGLLILGGLLMAGLFTRLASVGAAGMLLLFYMAVPPWPGVPGVEEGPSHSLIVNSNLIEAIACLAFACLPSGRWFGIDALIHRLLFGTRKP